MPNDDDLIDDLREAVKSINAYYEELEGESPRAAAILAVASLEDELERLIRTKFPKNITRQVWKKIAGPTAALGSYNAKIHLSRAFGFYGHETLSTLETISTIRNKFAHRKEVRSFDHPLIREQASKLSKNPFSAFSYSENSKGDEIRYDVLNTIETIEKSLSNYRGQLLMHEEPAPLP